MGGQAGISLRSNGSFVSRGFMRATGALSYLFHVGVMVENSSLRALPSTMNTGRVFGTDTPGDRQKNWHHEGHNEDVRQNWLSIASNAKLKVSTEYNLSGVVGVYEDVVLVFVQFVGLAAVSHPGLALTVVLGSHLARPRTSHGRFPDSLWA